MKIAFVYNLRTKDSEDEAELLTPAIIKHVVDALEELGHRVAEVEASGNPSTFVDRLLAAAPDLIFNAAEGRVGSAREAFYPGLYEQLGIPFTGAGPSLLHMNLDKHLAKTVVAAHGVNVPKGVLVTKKGQALPGDLRYPLMVKPNAEGSSKGISQDSVVETPEAAAARIENLLTLYPAGAVVEEFIEGRELSVPLLEAYPGKLLEIVEHTFNLESIGGKFNIYDYAMKSDASVADRAVNVVCPPPLTAEERAAVTEMARRAFEVMNCPDLGRVDIRLRTDGTPYFIELNPLPSLHPRASMNIAARACGLSEKDVMRLVVRSAARRFGIPVRSPQKPAAGQGDKSPARPTIRELGLFIGRLPTGVQNAITDVKGVRVGHVTHIESGDLPGIPGTAHVRTGLTAVLPADGSVFKRNVAAGGHIINGSGEMAGLSRVMEWGWLETPILLTSTMGVDVARAGLLAWAMEKSPQIGVDWPIVVPVVAGADDSYLNDIRARRLSTADVRKAIEGATGGAVRQGSVGAGTGQISFGFAGGIGTASRVLRGDDGDYVVGVLVLANFGRMVNLTVEGAVVGRHLDTLYPAEANGPGDGSVTVIIATDAPLLPQQLSALAKRSSLGLARVGSFSAARSGEFALAFSTGNRLAREEHGQRRGRTLRTLGNSVLNVLFEGVVEATEEASLNAICCSSGMSGRQDRLIPALPHETVLELLGKGRVKGKGKGKAAPPPQ